MSHYTMHAAINYAALPPTSPLQLPFPYIPPPPPPPPPLLLPLLSPSPPPPAVAASDTSFPSRISPSVLLIILILAVIFFVSGLLHLLVRFLLRPAPRDPGDAYGGDAHATAFQGQLQQLFHLHDAGVDQSFIDALPVFLYGAVVGVAGGKDPFDCAVCLCEFADDDRLRLLPKCSHAFHVDCIDTWLLSHSTCPLCRSSLLADFSPYGGGCSQLVFVLESGSEGSVSDRLDAASSARLSFVMEQEEAGQDRKYGAEAAEKKDEVVVPVKLGKFRSQVPTEVGGAGSGGCSANPDQEVRRCYSMGTYEYVMDESSLLRVAVKPPDKKRSATRMPGHRVAMSECDCHSKREGFRGFDALPKQPLPSKAAVDKRESFSFSKIWMRGGPRRKDGAIAAPSCSTSRRVSSFRLSSALQRTASDVGVAAVVPKRRADVVSPVTESEYNVSAWDKSASGSVVDWDLESAGGGNGHCLSSRADEAPSFARRTLLWIRGHL
ncbi:putative RING-H2 finger protein ATL49 [Phragmites australis]|uniref:putative RING-H2 finger protein ATL49 n=1 Tax=Phragmites australis TaxID=29695 RepID=UPI002D79A4DC|nr:putative RING-H2 finger protein ATL49 [Phragmites australis]